MEKFVILLFFSFLLFPNLVSADEGEYRGYLNVEHATIYDELGQSVGTITSNQNGLTYYANTIQDKVMIRIGGKSFFIQREVVTPQESTASVQNDSPIGIIKTSIQATFYSEPSTESSPLLTTSTELQLEVLAIENDFYLVNIAGSLAYLPIAQGTSIFENPQAVFKVLVPHLPYYEMSNGKLIQKGTLTKGTIWSRVKESSGYHIVRIGTKDVYIPILHTFPSVDKPLIKSAPKAKYPITLLTERAVHVYDLQGTVIGTLIKGTSLNIRAISGKYAVIEFLGREAKVEFSKLNHTNLLNSKKNISHAEMSFTVQVISLMYPEFTKLEQIGKSVEGRPIYALRLGNGKKEVLFDGSLHAREHMSTNVLLEMIDTYSFHYLRNSTYAGYNPRKVLDQVAIWFVPMMNPDGVTLVQSGAKNVKNGPLATKINGGTNFARWKANVRGVDLNDNFDAGWINVKSSVTKPSFAGFKGPRAFSEPESVALRDFVLKHSFKSYISYHSSGQIIYWFQWQKGAQATRDLTLARKITSLTGYSVVHPMYLRGSGSSADWFIEKTKMPGLTIEISPYVGNKPVPISHWDRIWKQNHKVGLFVAQDASKR